MSESAGSQPPGWYHAQGDPDGTQRYWDGSQWVGGPQQGQDASAVQAGDYGVAAAPSFSTGVTGNPATYGTRVVAALIDIGYYLGIVVAGFVLGFIVGLVSDQLGAIILLLGIFAGVIFALWNLIVRQGQTGQTLGKSKKNIMLVSDQTRQAPGVGQAIIRYFLGGLINNLCLLDILWPLFDEDTKRLSDKILNLSVLDV